MFRLTVLCCCMLLCRLMFAQENTPPPTGSAERPLAAPSEPTYGGDLSSRGTLTGDWGGRRDELAQHGYTFNLGITQVLQGECRRRVSRSHQQLSL